MHDISELEAQWKRYKAKKRKPYYIGGVAFLLLVTALFFSMGTTFNFKNLATYLPTFTKTENSKYTSTTSSKPGTTILNRGLKELAANTKEVTHKIELQVEPEETLVDIPILDLNGGEKPTVHHSKNKKIKLEIVETSSISAYRDVEERFSKSHDIDDAFFLAKSYFNKGDYEKSAYWALETNKLDESHEESLLIFAESKVKMGKRNEGVSILKRYISKTNSAAAYRLLSKIESNRL